MITNLGEEDFKKVLPDFTTNITVRGLKNSVDVFRDQYGIPHVRAQSLYDAFFAQGFVHAQDRLWQMEYDRRRAYGRLSELTGRGIEIDIFARRTCLGRSAETDYEGLNEETQLMLGAYADGVNAFVELTDELPIEFKILEYEPETWKPWDSCAIFKIRHILMGTFQNKLLRARLLKALGAERLGALLRQDRIEPLFIVPSDREYQDLLFDISELKAGYKALENLPQFESGSNNWAISGTRTASGKPLVAGDPHRALDVPNVYYQNHLSCPDFNVIGYSFAGVPGFPHFGHNESVSWCITHAMADYQDLFVERFKPDDPSQYEFMGEWRHAEISKEKILIRAKDPIDVEITVTHHGPVVIGDPRQGIAITLRYTATVGMNICFEAFLPMLKAGSVAELKESQRPWVDPCNNMVMADIHGDICYLTRGKVPIRSKANGWLPVPGWSGEQEWEGFIPFEEMPQSLNPECGYIVTANNRITDPAYPFFITTSYAPPHRAIRIVDYLEKMVEAQPEDMTVIHNDTESLPARLFIKKLLELEISDWELKHPLEYLKNWDFRMEVESIGAALYIITRDQLTRLITSKPCFKPLDTNPFSEVPGIPGLNPLDYMMWNVVPRLLERDDRELLSEGEDWGELLLEALKRAVSWLKENLGPDMEDWNWGKVHRTIPIHPLYEIAQDLGKFLNPPSIPMGGDTDTPKAAGISPGVTYRIAYTSVARYVFDMGDWDRSGWISPLGASGHPGSPHFADQSELWAKGELIPMIYSWNKIESEAKQKQVLEPI